MSIMGVCPLCVISAHGNFFGNNEFYHVLCEDLILGVTVIFVCVYSLFAFTLNFTKDQKHCNEESVQFCLDLEEKCKKTGSIRWFVGQKWNTVGVY